MATAGLTRLGLEHRITQRLDPTVFPYAIGQGALGIEVKEGSDDMLRIVRAADHAPSRWRSVAERAMLRSLQGGCSSPVGVFSSFVPLEGIGAENVKNGSYDIGTLKLHGTVLDIEGIKSISAHESVTVQGDGEAEELGVSVARMLLQQGANSLLSKGS